MEAKYEVSYDEYSDKTWNKVVMYVTTPIKAERKIVEVRHYHKVHGTKVRNLRVLRNGKPVKLDLTDEQKQRVREQFHESLIESEAYFDAIDAKAIPVAEQLLKAKKFPFRAWMVRKGKYLAWVIPGYRFNGLEEEEDETQVGRMMLEGVKRQGQGYIYRLSVETCGPCKYEAMAMKAIMETAQAFMREDNTHIVEETENSISFINDCRVGYDEEVVFLLRIAGAVRDTWNEINK